MHDRRDASLHDPANSQPPVTGTLKGHDQLMNLVLDNVKEITRGKRSQRAGGAIRTK